MHDPTSDDDARSRPSHLLHVVRALRRQIDDNHIQLRKVQSLLLEKEALLHKGALVLQQQCSSMQNAELEGLHATASVQATLQGWRVKVEVQGPLRLLETSRCSISAVHCSQPLASTEQTLCIHTTSNGSGLGTMVLHAVVSVLKEPSHLDRVHVFLVIKALAGAPAALHAGTLDLSTGAWLQGMAQAPPERQSERMGHQTTLKLGDDSLERSTLQLNSILEQKLHFSRRTGSQQWRLGEVAEAVVAEQCKGLQQVMLRAESASLLDTIVAQLRKEVAQQAESHGLPVPTFKTAGVGSDATTPKQHLLVGVKAAEQEIDALKTWLGALQASQAAADTAYRVQKESSIASSAVAAAQDEAVKAMMACDLAVAAALHDPPLQSL